MAKEKTTVYFCQECGYESAKWMGQCPGCGEWNTFVEETIRKGSSASGKRAAKAEVMKLADIHMEGEERQTTSMPELDRVLGGGIPSVRNTFLIP